MSIVFPVLLVLLLAGAVVVAYLRQRAPRTRVALEVGEALLVDVPRTTRTVALLERWRDRAGRWRRGLAVPVVVVTLAVGTALRQSVNVGVGAHPAWSDPLLTGLLGVFLGAIAAELHHLRPRPGGPRQVELVPRELAAYLPARSRRRVGLLAVAALASIVLAVVRDAGPPLLGFLALTIVVLGPVVQRGIVLRGRPAVPSDLRAADDAVRALAVRSVGDAGAGASLLLTAWQLAPVYAVDGPELLAAGLVGAQLVAIVTAIRWWWRSSPRRLLPDVPAALDPRPVAGDAT